MINNLFIKPLLISFIGLFICYFIDKRNDKGKIRQPRTNKYLTIFIIIYVLTFFVSICYSSNNSDNIVKKISQSGGDCALCPF